MIIAIVSHTLRNMKEREREREREAEYLHSLIFLEHGIGESLRGKYSILV